VGKIQVLRLLCPEQMNFIDAVMELLNDVLKKKNTVILTVMN